MIKKTEAIKLIMEYLDAISEHVESVAACNEGVVKPIDFYCYIQELKLDMVYDICDAKEE